MDIKNSYGCPKRAEEVGEAGEQIIQKLRSFCISAMKHEREEPCQAPNLNLDKTRGKTIPTGFVFAETDFAPHKRILESKKITRRWHK